jgi:hypothetical protein
MNVIICSMVPDQVGTRTMELLSCCAIYYSISDLESYEVFEDRGHSRQCKQGDGKAGGV